MVSLVALAASHISASAHEGRPLFIEIEERDTGAVFLKWRVPATIDRANRPQIQLPPACEKVQQPQASGAVGSNIGQGLFDCSALDVPIVVEVTYPQGNPSVSTLVRVIRPSGEVQIVRSGPGVRTIAIPSAESAGSVVGEYLVLGFEHIMAGYDHLLFVVCLLLLAGTFRRVLVIITGFTLAHSVTLALAALEIVQVPVAPLEAVIALSIVFVAAELVRPGRESLTWRYPMLISSGFGLLHGFGFAAVLGEIGLPQTEVPLALLFFNLGVEVGQISFILVLVAGFALVSRLLMMAGLKDGPAHAADFMKPVGYVVGALACFWTFERVAAFVA
jgi:hydrogenase/urease accessory protein HupE